MQRKALFGNYCLKAPFLRCLPTARLSSACFESTSATEAMPTSPPRCSTATSLSADPRTATGPEGDLVAVELLDPLEVWNVKRRRKTRRSARRSRTDNSRASLDKARTDLEVEGAQLRLIEDEEETSRALPTCRSRRRHRRALAGQLFSGTLGLLRPSSGCYQGEAAS